VPVGEERRAAEVVRVPEGDDPLTEKAESVPPVGEDLVREIQEHRVAEDHRPPEERLPEERGGEGGKEEDAVAVPQ